jgi:hypothetical protein
MKRINRINLIKSTTFTQSGKFSRKFFIRFQTVSMGVTSLCPRIIKFVTKCYPPSANCTVKNNHLLLVRSRSMQIMYRMWFRVKEKFDFVCTGAQTEQIIQKAS